MTHQTIENKDFKLMYCDCNKQPQLTLLNKRDKRITSLSIKIMIERLEKLSNK